MRRGELLGLQWGDIDLDAVPPTLRIERSVEETKAGLRLKPPKTKRGRRSVSLPAETVDLLRALKVEAMKLPLALGVGKLEDTAPVFGTIEGRLRSPHGVSQAWRRFLDSNRDLPKVQFHALRHTHVSTLIHAGVDILTISRRIGHSGAAITLDVYGHPIDGADAKAAKAIGGILGTPREQ
jgi:integrase